MNAALRRIEVLAMLLVSGLLACTAPAAADSERGALEAAIHRWVTAVNAQDVAALNATMTADVELSDVAATVTGRDAAIRALRDVVSNGQLIETTREISIANDVAWHTVGLAQARKNGDVQPRGQALEIWKRVNGAWQLHRRMAAGTGMAEHLLTRPPSKEPVLDRQKE